MKAYAGIGSRTITEEERSTIIAIAERLSEDYVLYSGNATGADIAFQTGSNGSCVLFVPWKQFNCTKYYHEDALVICPRVTYESDISVDDFHPCPEALSHAARSMMRRNYHQVMGYDDLELPVVDFVICCADPQGNGVKGGTGQAVRIANAMGIPVFNVRSNEWEEKLEEFLTTRIKVQKMIKNLMEHAEANGQLDTTEYPVPVEFQNMSDRELIHCISSANQFLDEAREEEEKTGMDICCSSACSIIQWCKKELKTRGVKWGRMD